MMITTLAALLLFANAPEVGAEFAGPVRLKAGDELMGKGMLFPSPALHDLDGDGVEEIVLGDLWGALMVAKRLPGDDRLAWSELELLKDAK